MRRGILAVSVFGSFFLAAAAMAESRVPYVEQGPAALQAPPGTPNLPAGSDAQVGSLLDSNGDGLSDGLKDHLSGLRGNEQVDVLVQTDRPGLASVLQMAVGPFNVTHEYSLIDGFAARVNAGQARALAAQAGVTRVELDVEATAFLESARSDFGIDDLLGHRDAAISGLTGAGVTACVIDTGIQGGHEQFYDGIYSRIVDFKDFTGGWSDEDFSNGINPFGTVYDDHYVGHGTHVAGILGGDGTIGSGPGADPEYAPRAMGGAPEVRLRIAKVLDFTGSGPDSDIVAAVEWCVGDTPEDGPDSDVINLSLGIAGLTDCTDILCMAVDAAVDAGAVVVAAAGNAGDAPGTIGSPGVSAKAITVGAIADFSANPNDPWHSSGVHAAIFSSQGPGAGGTVKPDLVGPGTSILSARNDVYIDPSYGLVVDNECGEGCYGILDGTSQAAPFVAAVAVLMKQANPDITPAEVKQILIDTAVDRLAAGPDLITGHGVVDAAAAVTEAARLSDRSIASMTNDLPAQATGTARIRRNSAVDVDVAVVDPTMPLAITVAIEGEVVCKLTYGGDCLIFEWAPDLDAYLYDRDGNRVFYSGCPAEGDSPFCYPSTAIAYGQLETLYVPQPTAGPYRLHIFAVQDSINNGEGGNVTYDISNGSLGGGGGGKKGGGGGSDGGGGKPCNPKKETCG
jgi:serine protease AprX